MTMFEYLFSFLLYPFYLVLAFVFVIAMIRLATFVKMFGVPRFNIDHKHRQFEDLRISANDFYSRMEDILEKKRYSYVKARRIVLAQYGVFASKREYLRVERDQYVFDICAAPFGKDSFVSWWLAMNITFFEQMLLLIPFVSKAYAKYLLTKTYYQMDTENMFRESIQTIVANIIAEMTELGPERQQLSDISVAAEEIA